MQTLSYSCVSVDVYVNSCNSLNSFCSVLVLEDQQNVRPIKELLHTLYVSLCSLVQDMGKSVLVGNINIWVHRMENILQWQQQLDNIQINRVSRGTSGHIPSPWINIPILNHYRFNHLKPQTFFELYDIFKHQKRSTDIHFWANLAGLTRKMTPND